MEICKAENCTGCMSCFNICPRNAICERQNERGFYVPFINEESCVNCGLCQKVCPVNHPPQISVTPEVFACWNKDRNVRRYSASGGMFTLFAEAVLKKNGVIFGAVYDTETGVVQHRMAETPEELRAMSGSKYVQSHIGNTYREVKKEIETGRMVLFSGTPCQCAGLGNFLGSQPENLYLVDFVCHGVPSPTVLKTYLLAMEQNDRIQNISFREKNPSWETFSMKLTFESGKEYISDMYTDPYLRLFLGDYDLNSCCYNCRYASLSRGTDITLGDFWGYISEKYRFFDDNKGISLVMVNSSKGKSLFEKIKTEAVYTKKTMSEAAAGNQPLTMPTQKAGGSDQFWKEFLKGKDIFSLSALKASPVHPSLKHRIRLLMDRFYFLMPSLLKKKYRRLKLKNAEKKRMASK